MNVLFLFIVLLILHNHINIKQNGCEREGIVFPGAVFDKIMQDKAFDFISRNSAVFVFMRENSPS